MFHFEKKYDKMFVVYKNWRKKNGFYKKFA